ncbi:PP2C family protein-serine/threonine phosphatase [Specibacter sp. NPDC057265]|uniref:PP2C family protein-serine/threonine phosphatase n=1 Tax=Specibacter sp. NPDC057265 TaxID=3346075 RepID=UPI0036311388
MAEFPLVLRYAARSHVGMVRAKNDDSAYAGEYLAVVADGMGGHAGGDVASASTVLDLVHLDHNHHDGDAGTDLADEIQSANSLLSELVHVNPKLAGMGTTVTALLLSGNRLAFAHIGDSRAYRLKDGIFEQLSTDHTFVQRMIEEGRMTEAEAEVHPHKNVLMRVLGDVDASPELDLQYFDASPGERWLLCSDGLNFVRPTMIEEVIRNTKSLAKAADTLIDLTLAAGSPDNVTVVVFDVAESKPDETSTAALETVSVDPSDEPELPPLEQPRSDGTGSPQMAAMSAEGNGKKAELKKVTAIASPSAASLTQADSATEGGNSDGDATSATDDPDPDALDAHIRQDAVNKELAGRKHELVGAALTANAEGKIPQLAQRKATQRAATVLTHKPSSPAMTTESDDAEVSLPRRRQRPWVLTLIGILAALVIFAASWAAYAWTQTQYYVGTTNGHVAIYQGVSQSLGPISLSTLHRETDVKVSSLPDYSQQLVAGTMAAASLGDAEQIISDLQLGTGTSLPPCELLETTAPSGSAGASPSPSAAPSARSSATASPSAVASSPAQASCVPGGGR